jgi:hypothetical protein
MVTHLRIHQANDVTWCGIVLSNRPANSVVNVVTRPPYKYGAERTADHVAHDNAVLSSVTCKRCTKNGTRFQPTTANNASNGR